MDNLEANASFRTSLQVVLWNEKAGFGTTIETMINAKINAFGALIIVAGTVFFESQQRRTVAQLKGTDKTALAQQ